MSGRNQAYSRKDKPQDEAGLQHEPGLVVDEFLVQITRYDRTRKVMWNGHAPLALDHPVTLELEKVGSRFSVRSKHTGNIVNTVEKDQVWIEDTGISIRRLNRPSPAFAPSSEDAIRLSMRGLKAGIFAMSGAEHSVLDFTNLGNGYVAKISGKKVFTLKRKSTGYTLTSFSSELVLEVGSREPARVSARGSAKLDHTEASNCVVRIGSHWWRFNVVGRPLPAMLVSMASPEIDLETKRFNSLMRKVVVGMIAVSFALWMHPLPQEVVVHFEPPAEKKPELIELVKPKVIVELKPKPIETPKPKPKPIEKPKAPAKKPEKPKAQPKKKAQPKPKAKPQPKPVAKQAAPKHKAEPVKVAKVAPKPKPAQAQAPKPTPPKPQGPTPEQVKAAAKAAAQANLAKSLGFLSAPTSKLAKAPPIASDDAPDDKYKKVDQGAASAASKSGKSVLGASSGSAGGAGPISTKNSRNVSSDSGLSGSYGAGGKGLNDVQGKVALNQLYDPNGADVGDALGGGSGMQMSGQGSISESAILKVLQKYQDRFNYCYEKALLAHPTIAGNLIMQWTINAGGRSSDVRVARSALNDAGLHSCMIRELGKITFPSPQGGAVTVKFPFSFSSSTL